MSFNFVIPSPPIPYYYYDNRLGRPCNIYIAGLLPSNSYENVSINLANSTDFPRINIPFQLSIRPQERILVRNSWTHHGEWATEERHTRSGFPMGHGGNFDLMLSIKYDRITVAINGQHAFDFTHRQSASTINTLQINGNVLISSIRYEFF